MKPYFFLSVLCFLFKSDAIASPMSPSFEFSRNVATQLYGAGRKGVLNCDVLINKQWSYPNAGVTSFCNEAQTSCLRLGLVEQALKKPSKDIERLKKDYALALNHLEMSLSGCYLAIEATISNAQSIDKAAGFSSSSY